MPSQTDRSMLVDICRISSDRLVADSHFDCDLFLQAHFLRLGGARFLSCCDGVFTKAGPFESSRGRYGRLVWPDAAASAAWFRG